MCVILYGDRLADIRERADLDVCARQNNDGVGLMFLSGAKGGVQTVIDKSKDSKDYRKLLEGAPEDRAIALHFRKCTHGKVDKNNAHPFILEKTGAALMHNGIVSGFGDKERSDTRELCEDVLSYLPVDSVRTAAPRLFDGSKILIAMPDGGKGKPVWFLAGHWYKDAGWRDGTCRFAQSSYVQGSEPGLSHEGRDRQQWQKEKKAVQHHWDAFCIRPSCFFSWTFDQWFQTIGHAIQRPRNVSDQSQSRKEYQNIPGADHHDWDMFLMRPIAMTGLSFAEWWKIELEDRAVYAFSRPDSCTVAQKAGTSGYFGKVVPINSAASSSVSPSPIGSDAAGNTGNPVKSDTGNPAVGETIAPANTSPAPASTTSPASTQRTNELPNMSDMGQSEAELEERWRRYQEEIAARQIRQRLSEPDISDPSYLDETAEMRKLAEQDAKRDIGGDTTLRGTVPVVAETPNATEAGDVTSKEGLYPATAYPPQAAAPAPAAPEVKQPTQLDKDLSGELPPWSREGKERMSAPRWCAKFPHRAAAMLETLWDIVVLPSMPEPLEMAPAESTEAVADQSPVAGMPTPLESNPLAD